MIRKHENAVSVKAGLLAIAVHALLFLGMFLSLSWQTSNAPMVVTEVELWDKLPAPTAPVIPEPKIQELPKPEPKVEPISPEPKPVEKPKETKPKVDIALEKKKKEERLKKEKAEQKKKALEEKRKKEKAKKKLAEQLRQEDLQAQKDAKLKKMQQAMLAEEAGKDDRKASAAMQGEVNKYKAKIIAKIKGNVNKSLCAGGNPELRFKVSVLPTGDIAGNPALVKSSGNSACDEAADRAILASQPLPLPADPAAKAQFRNLVLKFKPNQ